VWYRNRLFLYVPLITVLSRVEAIHQDGLDAGFGPLGCVSFPVKRTLDLTP